MKKKRFLHHARGMAAVVLTIIMFFGLLPAIPAKADNNTYMTAEEININTRVTDNLTSSSDVNWYKFTTTADGYVSFSFAHEYVDADRNYWKLDFYNADQKSLIGTQYYNGKVLPSRTDTSCNIGIPAGTYYVKVEDSYDSNYYYSDVWYYLTVNYTQSATWETELNDTYVTADTIPVNTEISASLGSSGDIDYYRFTVPKDGYVSFSFRHEYVDADYNYWTLDFYNADQDSLMATHYYTGKVLSSRTEKSCNVGVPAGTYYIKVKKNYYYDGATYYLTVNYSESDVWETELNDNVTVADPIKMDVEYHGSTNAEVDDDWYRFSVPERGYISVSFRHGYVDSDNSFWRLYLMDEDQKELLSDSYRGKVREETSTTTETVSVTSGNYYVKIASWNRYCWSGEDYHFTINWHPIRTVRFDSNGGGNVAMTLEMINGRSFGTLPTPEAPNNATEFTGWFTERDGGTQITAESVFSGNADMTLYAHWVGITPEQVMYRLYNPNSGEHFYTADTNERDYLDGIGWNYEGPAWVAPMNSGTPVYRLYNPNAGDHHYTPNADEKDMLVALGWSYEGIGWYSDDQTTTPLYRLYNPNATGAGTHHYTVNSNERDSLVSLGWTDEGIGWYGR